MKFSDLPEINAYVTAKGGVVVLNGQFPIDKAERVKALCNAAPQMLAVLQKILPFLEDERDCRETSGIENHYVKSARDACDLVEGAIKQATTLSVRQPDLA